MLGRKQSLRRCEVLLTDYGPEETFNESANIEWVNKLWIRRFFRLCALMSLISVCLNTPQTYRIHFSLIYVTLVIDVVVTFFFTAEMVAKMHIQGLIRGDKPYCKDKWCQFDAVMTLFHWISVILHVLEVTDFVARDSSLYSFVRAPRPLIMIRFMRVFLKFSMPKARIRQIFKRSSQQIYNVTLFFLFFMTLYGLLGVQLFGPLIRHCVVNGTDPSALTLNHLAVPDTHCSHDGINGHMCPVGMQCIELDLEKKIAGFSGFDNIFNSFFTVYQASSQEGWSHLMYQAMDSLPPWRAAAYFITMIFFLAWLVKNVFIAVITETFNEIRVQFQQMWGERVTITPEATPQVLRGDDSGWKLIELDENHGAGQFRAPRFVRQFIQTAAFQVIIMMGIVVDAIVAASVSFEHDGRPRWEFYKTYYYAEIAMTIFFDVELLLKLWCYGAKGYYRLTFHKFELTLAVMTTLHIIPDLFLSMLAFFQVLRVVRLIKASPVLEDFVSKIFGPGKKLGSLIIFTICLLIIISSISMQLFCSLKYYNKFRTFPEAFMSMFQILTQEGWTEMMNETMLRTKEPFGPFVAVYFILYHLFVSLIVLSLFVAVILDNLELDEDIKKVKQLKAREQSASISEELPLRLRVFERFPDSPQMTKLNKVSSEFVIPKVRESFMRSFIDDEEEETPSMKKVAPDQEQLITYRKTFPIRLLTSPAKVRTANVVIRKSSVNRIVSDSNYHRLLIGDSGQIFVPGKNQRIGDQVNNKLTRYDAKSIRRSVRGSIKMKHTYDHLKENGGEITDNPAAGATARNPHDFDIKLLQRKRQQAEMKRNQREEDLRENHPFFDTPLFFVGRESRFRRLCQLIVYAQYDPRIRDPVTGKERKIRYKGIHNLLGLVTYLDWIMIIVTTLSCISMMFEKPHYRIANHSELQIMEYVFVTMMAIELSLKTLADGLLFTPKALVKDVAGIMDFFIFAVTCVFIGWMPEKVEPSSKQQFILLLRCIRPLRIFSLVPHMRKVVYELCRGFKEIALVSVLLIVLVSTFACYGVHMFGGLLARCNDPDISTPEECVGVFFRRLHVTKMKVPTPPDDENYPEILVPRVWANPRRFNFDNIGNAMLALFEVLSFKGWLDIRDVILQRLGPIHTIYIHVYVFLGSMIGLTLFVGVVIANYGENKGTALLTVDQRRWCDLKKRLKIAQPLHLPPRPDHHKIRAFFYDITQHIAFKRLIAILVLINSSLLCVSWDKNENHTVPLATISSVLTMMFTIEVFIKAIAFTPRGYWQSRRNRYDLLVTVLGVIWVILHITLMNEISYSCGFIVVILRFFTITGKHATLKMLMLTVAVSVYKSFFIIMGMFLLILFYALMGVILFGNVKYGEAIGRHANFKTAIHGIITLFRIVTGEDWNKIMHDCMITRPYCTPGDNYWETDCGNFKFSLLYFCSFYVIITYIVLNLLVAIIMENFSLFYSNEEDALLSYADIRNFQNTWNMVDTQQRGMIPVRRVKFLLRLLKGRLEVDLEKDRLLFKHMVHEMERLHNGEDVTFHDVISMLSYRSVDIRKSLQLEELMAREELEYIIVEEVAKQTIRQWLDKCFRRIKQQRQQSLIQSLRATNEPFYAGLGGLSPGREESLLERKESVKEEKGQDNKDSVGDAGSTASVSGGVGGGPGGLSSSMSGGTSGSSLAGGIGSSLGLGSIGTSGGSTGGVSGSQSGSGGLSGSSSISAATCIDTGVAASRWTKKKLPTRSESLTTAFPGQSKQMSGKKFLTPSANVETSRGKDKSSDQAKGPGTKWGSKVMNGAGVGSSINSGGGIGFSSGDSNVQDSTIGGDSCGTSGFPGGSAGIGLPTSSGLGVGGDSIDDESDTTDNWLSFSVAHCKKNANLPKVSSLVEEVHAWWSCQLDDQKAKKIPTTNDCTAY
ncbi:sodium leak channel NALCN-like isoform X1 [Panonychus citri]|uniref:sodium leak channel NALCN-like isoform X1 n=1 Tax=Panonychus citri TaxID=50023 RepID=UPI002307CF77|nr:sodium leak channel NALCN-like isoform X1 [Panonychus citri]